MKEAVNEVGPNDAGRRTAIRRKIAYGTRGLKTLKVMKKKIT